MSKHESKYIFVGYTNGYQIGYAKDSGGAFYPDTENDCYIPLYMLEIHKHRLELDCFSSEIDKRKVSMQHEIELMQKDIGFLQSCINSGELAEKKDYPSYKHKVTA